MSDIPLTVSALLSDAFANARKRHEALHKKWVEISFRIGGRLPNSLLSVSVQREGELDLLVRCLEDEMANLLRQKKTDNLFTAHRLQMMSIYWVGGIYEIVRLLRERSLVEGEEFEALTRDFELLRIPLEKHEIPKDRKIKGILPLVRVPRRNDDSNHYEYDPSDVRKAHIMPAGLSKSGSYTWQVADVVNSTERWLERRSLSDRFVSLWAVSN